MSLASVPERRAVSSCLGAVDVLHPYRIAQWTGLVKHFAISVAYRCSAPVAGVLIDGVEA